VDEPTAWLNQARADRQAAERFGADEDRTGRCHAIAKLQQTLEKAVKAMVAALYDAGLLATGVRAKHDVERYVGVLVRLPRAAGHRTIQSHLHGLLDQNTRARIKVLDNLAPQMPPRRNTEYPFQDAQGRWTYPAADGVFTAEEVREFRALAYRVLDGADRIVSVIRRRPR
jgi:hypothetical protein